MNNIESLSRLDDLLNSLPCRSSRMCTDEATRDEPRTKSWMLGVKCTVLCLKRSGSEIESNYGRTTLVIIERASEKFSLRLRQGAPDPASETQQTREGQGSDLEGGRKRCGRITEDLQCDSVNERSKPQAKQTSSEQEQPRRGDLRGGPHDSENTALDTHDTRRTERTHDKEQTTSPTLLFTNTSRPA